jgi:hypothetical protein
MYSKSRHKGASSRIATRHKIRRYTATTLKSLSVLLFFIGTVFAVRANFWQVTRFEVVGTSSISNEAVQNLASSFLVGNKFLFVPRSNIFAFDEEMLKNKLLSEFTRLGEVEVNKNIFSRSVEVKVAERGAEYLWCSATEECFFMSNDGLIFEKVSPEKSFESAGKIIFRGLITSDPLLQNFATGEQMQNYTEFLDTLAKNNIHVDEISIESPEKAIAETSLGQIFFSPKDPDLATAAFNSILLIEEVKTKNPAVRFEYIDARFGNKVFYKAI